MIEDKLMNGANDLQWAETSEMRTFLYNPWTRHATGCQQKVDAFHASFQALLENILVPDCLL